MVAAAAAPAPAPAIAPLPFAHPRSCSPIIRVPAPTCTHPPLARSCLFMPACLCLLSYLLIYPATRSNLFGLCLAFVRAHSRLLACVLLYAAPRYLVILIWPLFGLVWARSCSSGLWLVSLCALRPLVYVYIKYTISTYMLINTLTFIACNLHKIY